VEVEQEKQVHVLELLEVQEVVDTRQVLLE
jgi:hypothetical protein